jgi:nicotinate-nucleotide adenylyltransferase
MRLGIFGGSFDPVHNGHLALARACQAEAALDEVWFTPAAIQPFKHQGPHATDAQRVEMLNLAIESADGDPRGEHRRSAVAAPRSAWRVCTLELERGGYSYTIDTLRQIHEELPEAELFFLLGADTVRDVSHWRDPAEIFRLATPLVVGRAGQPEPNLAALDTLCSHDHRPISVVMPAVDVSSSEIRRRIVNGEPVAAMVPASVAVYIQAQRLYR